MNRRILDKLRGVWACERGGSLSEYLLMLALVSLGLTMSQRSIAVGMSNAYAHLTIGLSNAMNGTPPPSGGSTGEGGAATSSAVHGGSPARSQSEGSATASRSAEKDTRAEHSK